MDKSNHFDRRRFQRLRVKLVVLYRIETPDVRAVTGEEEFETYSLDLCEGGISFPVDHYIPPFTTLSLRFFLFKYDNRGVICFDEPIEAIGEVRSSLLTETKKFRLGLCFRKIENSDRIKMANFLRATLSPPAEY